MATIVHKTINGNGYAYHVEYVGGKHHWEYLGPVSEVGLEEGATSLSKEEAKHHREEDSNEDESPGTAGTLDGVALIDPDGWEISRSQEPVEHGPEKDAEKAESVAWRLDRDRMNGGDLLVKLSPNKSTDYWHVNLGFIDQLESEELVVADSREEALERANQWLSEHANDPPTDADQVHPLYEENVTNGFITDRETAEHWGEQYFDEDVASAEYDGFEEYEANRRRRRTMQSRAEGRQIDDDRVIKRNEASAGDKWRVDLSEDGENAWNAVVGYTAANADRDEYDGDYQRLQGMSQPTLHGGDDRAETVSDADIEAVRDAVQFVEEHADEDPDEAFDGMDEVRELFNESDVITAPRLSDEG